MLETSLALAAGARILELSHRLYTLAECREIQLRRDNIESLMADVTMYSTSWCVDCRRAKKFLADRGVSFTEINIDEEPDAEDLVLEVNAGLRKVPTIKVGDRYFACSPFDPYQLSEELNLPLNI